MFRDGNDLSSAAGGVANSKTELHPTSSIECFRQVFKSQIMDGRDYWTRCQRRRSVLDVQDVDRPPAQFSSERQRYAHQGRVRQGLFDFEVRPTTGEALDGFPFGDVKGIAVCWIDFGEGFDQVSRVSFVAAQFGSDGMSIDGDVQNDPVRDG